jgi:hypothetical protein
VFRFVSVLYEAPSLMDNSRQLKGFIQDIVARNWGDNTVFDHKGQEIWSEMLGLYPIFRQKFVAATMMPLEKRREHRMTL